MRLSVLNKETTYSVINSNFGHISHRFRDTDA